MARSMFGGSLSAWTFTAQDAAAQYGAGALVARVAPTATVTFWDSQTGGVQYVSLLAADNATAITSVTTDSVGEIPILYGPDGITLMWADAGGARRVINPNGAQAGTNGTNGTNGIDGTNGTNGAPGPGLNYLLGLGGAAYGPRPITAIGVPVIHLGTNQPSYGGTVSSQTTAVAGLDIWIRTPF